MTWAAFWDICSNVALFAAGFSKEKTVIFLAYAIYAKCAAIRAFQKEMEAKR